MIVSSNVPALSTSLTVVTYLASRFTYLPETSWSQFVREGRIFCNGVICDEATMVVKGDTIRCNLPEFGAPEVNYDYSIVYEDDWLVAVNKPAGLRVHSRGKFINANLIYHLRHIRQPAYPGANPVNRLDTDTSGLVLVSRDKKVLSQLMRQFAQGQVVKSYLAVIKGRPVDAEGTVNLPIGPVEGAKVPRFGVYRKQGKAAVTHYKTVRTLSDAFTLLELSPENGRTHQLRVHMAAIGHPIAGDALYTMSDDDYLDWLHNPSRQTGLKRQALHSHRLEFSHPALKTTCSLSAPIAADIQKFISEVSAADQSAV